MANRNASNHPARKRNLSRLRVEAGYACARDFAEASGIPEGSYYRYEAHCDRIPLDRAWQIADLLGVSIDAVVGREEIGAPRPRTLQSVMDGLQPTERACLAAYIEFLESRTEKEVC